MRIAFACLVVVAGLTAAAAQGPVFPRPQEPAKPRLRDTEHAIVVEGCVRGNRLKIHGPGASRNVAVEAIGASEFILEGPKELLQRLRSEHDNHQDEITGIAIIPVSRTDEVDVKTRKLGDKTRVTMGVTTGDPDVGRSSAFKPVRLKVESLAHLADKCSIAHQ
jgi:hypothetical protein